LRLTLLSVGAGQCAVVHSPGGKLLLFDCGASPGRELVRRTLAPYLKQMGRSRADSLYISHANSDHLNAAVDAVERLGIGEVYLTPYFAPHAADHPEAKVMLDAVRGERIIAAGHRAAVDEHTSLEVIWPAPGLPLLPNDSSMVVKVTCHGRSVLITGDVQSVGQRFLLREPGRLKCDVLVAPHHGSVEVTTGALLEACSARHVVSSNDSTLSQKQRRLEALLGELGGQPPLRTHQSGAVMVDIAPDGSVTARTFLGDR
jgi:competence protein ComEC